MSLEIFVKKFYGYPKPKMEKKVKTETNKACDGKFGELTLTFLLN